MTHGERKAWKMFKKGAEHLGYTARLDEQEGATIQLLIQPAGYEESESRKFRGESLAEVLYDLAAFAHRNGSYGDERRLFEYGWIAEGCPQAEAN